MSLPLSANCALPASNVLRSTSYLLGKDVLIAPPPFLLPPAPSRHNPAGPMPSLVPRALRRWSDRRPPPFPSALAPPRFPTFAACPSLLRTIALLPRIAAAPPSRGSYLLSKVAALPKPYAVLRPPAQPLPASRIRGLFPGPMPA